MKISALGTLEALSLGPENTRLFLAQVLAVLIERTRSSTIHPKSAPLLLRSLFTLAALVVVPLIAILVIVITTVAA